MADFVPFAGLALPAAGAPEPEGEGVLVRELLPADAMRLRPFYEGATVDRSASGGGGATPSAAGEPEPSAPTSEEIERMLAEAEARLRASAEAEYAAAREELERSMRLVDELVVKIEATAAERARQAALHVGEFLVKATRAALGGLPGASETLLRNRIPAIAEQMARSGKVEVRVAPADLEMARAVVGPRSGWTVVEDPGITGGCVVSGDPGVVDASLGTALEAIESAIEAWRDEVRALEVEEER